MIGLARLVADRCAVELGFDVASTMFRASFGVAGQQPALVVLWGEGLAVVQIGDSPPQEVTELPRLAALCDAALATL